MRFTNAMSFKVKFIIYCDIVSDENNFFCATEWLKTY